MGDVGHSWRSPRLFRIRTILLSATLSSSSLVLCVFFRVSRFRCEAVSLRVILLRKIFTASQPSHPPGRAFTSSSSSSSLFSSFSSLFSFKFLFSSSSSSTFSMSLFLVFNFVLLVSFVSCLAGPDYFRSEVQKSLIFDTNTRSGLFSNRALRFDFGFDRLCSVPCKSEESASTVIPFCSPLMGRSKRSFFLNPTGVCNLSYSSSRQDKYKLPTPIVLNLYSKFTADFGVLHGLKSVMDEVYYASSICIRRVVLGGDRSYHNCTSRRVRYKLYSPLVLNLDSKLFFGNFGLSLYGTDGVPESMGFVSVSIDYVYWLKDLLLDRICYRHCTACVIGLVVMDKHTDTTSFGLLTGDSFVNPPSRTLSSQTVIPAPPETYRNCCSTSAAAWKETTKLGQSVLNLMGHGPSFVLLMGYEPYIVFSYLIVRGPVTEQGF